MKELGPLIFGIVLLLLTLSIATGFLKRSLGIAGGGVLRTATRLVRSALRFLVVIGKWAVRILLFPFRQHRRRVRSLSGRSSIRLPR